MSIIKEDNSLIPKSCYGIGKLSSERYLKIYQEQLPIRVPANVSIKGDEFRRTIVRPASGVSSSIWAGIHFFRDTTFDSLTLASQNYGYHYLTDVTNSSSAKKNNADMDVFLMGDATIIRNMTIQGHGGFAQVLDPEGQILTKSPYIQTGASFSRVENKKSRQKRLLTMV